MAEKKEATVVCVANLTGTDKCPRDCQRCIYGGNIVIVWTGYASGSSRLDYIQHFPNKEAVRQAFYEARGIYSNMLKTGLANNSIGQKMVSLQIWLYKNFPEWWKA